MSGYGARQRDENSPTGRRAPASRGRARAALSPAAAGAGMLVREVSVRPPDVVFVKGLVEASDGLCAVFAERGGDLFLCAPRGREAELDELCADLEAEVGARLREPSRVAPVTLAASAGGVTWDESRQER
jgi:hypothetical protein